MGRANDRSEGHVGAAGSHKLESAAVDPVLQSLTIRDNRGMSWFPGNVLATRETFLKFNWEIFQHNCICVKRGNYYGESSWSADLRKEERACDWTQSRSVGQGRNPLKSV